jgi:hypothetical protein
MKILRMHLISVSIIILMVLFGLSTSYGVKTMIQITNNSSQNIIIKITINGFMGLYDEETNSWIDYSEELMINKNQTEQLKILRSLNSWPEPSELIGSIVIYNEDKEIIKELNRENSTGGMAYLLNNFKRSGSRHNRIFTLIITDKLLE